MKDGLKEFLKKYAPEEEITYIKKKDLTSGSIYKTATGKEYLYVGRFYFDYGFEFGKDNFPTLDTYLKSERYESFKTHFIDNEEFKGGYFYIKMTKKTKEMFSTCKSLDEFFEVYFTRKENLPEKYREKPLKVVEKVEDLFTGDLTTNYYPWKKDLDPECAKFFVAKNEPNTQFGYNYVVPV